MPEFLDDPSVLTKDKLKSELLAHNVELPSGNPNKDVYVQLYLKKLTSLNSRSPAMTLDAFSSDEELPPPVVSNRSRSSGKKTSRKQEKVVAEELDVTSLTDEGLRDELLKHGVEAGPIVASTRKLYERKLQKLLDEDNDDKELTRPPIVNCIVTEIQVTSHNHNGNSETDLYSDKEDEVTPEPDPEPEPVVEPEPVPVVEKPVRSRGKIAVTTRTGSSQHHTVEKIAASDQTKVDESDVLKELFPNDLNSPSGLSVTCRRPIRGAAGRPVKHSDLWNNENFHFSPKITKTTTSSSSYTESHISNRVSSPPVANSTNSSSSSKILAAAPPAGRIKAARSSMSMWKKLFMLVILGAFVFLVYQNMETNSVAPFVETEAAGGGSA
ncbi:thymopoietin a isoform X2 [Synchiropus splendidus]|uniref:thymopoietin a isoform X2 n=1 Tax=Synchiropus splendidus TaxID=270530 RepID=UPI00237E39AB|nr:thymopoietin a isoform X2 [Synchiropus splendidus]